VRERGGVVGTVLAGIGLVVVVIVLILFAVCGDDDNDNNSQHGLAKTSFQLVSHYRGGDDGDCWDEDCGGDYGGYHGDYGGGGNGNRGRRGDSQRGDKNCHSFCGNTVIIPDPTGHDQPPPDEQPQSLFPVPTPGGIQKFVMSTVEAGIGLGRLFANATIDFVSSMLVGLA
jgi:hypothetical protein